MLAQNPSHEHHGQAGNGAVGEKSIISYSQLRILDGQWHEMPINRQITKTLAELILAAKDHTDALVTAKIVSADELKYVFADRQARAKVAKQLADEGLSTRQIASIQGVSHKTVARDLNASNDTENVSNDTSDDQPEITLAKKREAALREQLRILQQPVAATTKRYGTIVIDPPWPMQKIERDVRPNQVAPLDYPTMDYEALRAFRVKLVDMIADDCHVFMWTTQKFLPMALRLFDDYGVKYVLTMVWHKAGGFQPVGLPQYNCEFVIYGRIGSPEFTDTTAFNCCFDGERREHSRKPDEFYAMIKRVTVDGRIDVFSREPRDGFDCYGNESTRFEEAAE